jgi:hypothetical protein
MFSELDRLCAALIEDIVEEEKSESNPLSFSICFAKMLSK